VSGDTRRYPPAARVELHGNEIQFRAVSYVERGHTVTEMDYSSARPPLTHEELGHHVTQALHRSREGLAQLGSLEEMRKKWRKQAGFRSENEYERGRKLVFVEQESANRYLLIPTRNTRKENGFSHLEERIVEAFTAAALGAAVQQALHDSFAE